MKNKGLIKILICLLLSMVIFTACGSSETSSGETAADNTNSGAAADGDTTTTQSGKEMIELGDKYNNLPQTQMPADDQPTAIIKTSMGDISVMFFPEQAPKTVENFLTHAKDGYYDGVTFHRVIDGFMIQGGDPKGTGMGGESIWGEYFEDEFSLDLFNFRGALSMANAGAGTNGSQFFIVQSNQMAASEEAMREVGFPEEAIEAYKEVGGYPSLDGKHTVFGQVYEGMDVVDEIAKVETSDDGSDKPVKDVTIKSIEVKNWK